MHDAAHLRAYAETGSEDAFAHFVRSVLPLVFGAALRRVGGDRHLAQDVAQIVFAAVARDAGRLSRHPDLAGWLFVTSRNLAAKAVRSERRRRHRELETARPPNADESNPDAAERLRPVLDEVIVDLRESDRQMLLLRFYSGWRIGEIAERVNSSENAVQKRIERALDRLRVLLERRGIASTAAALAVAMELNGAVAIPAGLAAGATAAGIAGGASGTVPSALTGLVSFTKLQLGAAAALVATAGMGVGWYFRENLVSAAERIEEAAQLHGISTLPQPGSAATTVPMVEPRKIISNEPAVQTDGSHSAPTVPQPVGPMQPRVAENPALPADGRKVPLQIEYPAPLFVGTPRPVGLPNLEPPHGPVPELIVPAGTKLLSKGRPVSSSDRLPVIGNLALVTDGDKRGVEGTLVELGPGLQWIQIDLGAMATIHAMAVWHFHAQARAYHDVVVQVSPDPGFSAGVVTIFNNDDDNSAKLGAGRDPAYVETRRGRTFTFQLHKPG